MDKRQGTMDKRQGTRDKGQGTRDKRHYDVKILGCKDVGSFFTPTLTTFISTSLPHYDF
jgi:hypothetical protein